MKCKKDQAEMNLSHTHGKRKHYVCPKCGFTDYEVVDSHKQPVAPVKGKE